MGIYTDLSIFGIRIYNISYDDDIYNLFQRKYDVIMMWYSITTNDFLEKFGIGNMKICKD